LNERNILLRLRAHLLRKLLALMAMMKVFDRLFESNGKQQADADGGDVDAEIAPGVWRMFGRVNVDHRAASFCHFFQRSTGADFAFSATTMFCRLSLPLAMNSSTPSRLISHSLRWRRATIVA
jgi:hypothetical protein